MGRRLVTISDSQLRLREVIGALEIGDELFWEPTRIVQPGAWTGHLATAFWLVKAIRPNVFVELGTHTGNSYSAFCQGVALLGLSTRCFAVDTWQGDEHAGYYDEEIFVDLTAFNDRNYAGFSKLLRTTFDDARNYFPDGDTSGGIDLLHIDGLHSYEAVKHDFETWKSALSRRSVVLFHDTNVRERGFGVWKFWRELAAQYPSFEFDHSEGLGVLGVGREQPSLVARLFEFAQDPSAAPLVRRLFASRGDTFRHRARMLDLEHHITNLSGDRSRLGQELELVRRDRDGQSQAHQNVERQLQQLTESLSWRATAPLRAIASGLRRLPGPSSFLETATAAIANVGRDGAGSSKDPIFANSCRRFRRWTRTRRDLHGSRRRLLSLPDLTPEEKGLLRRVSLRVHPGDSMYAGDGFHYLAVGLSANRCIRDALRSAKKPFPAGSILDFPSGYGRVLRFLRAGFPNADITAAEIDVSALDFCRRSFDATMFVSTGSFRVLSLPRQFDLIWCGSLLTHIDEHAARDLLRLFREHLSQGGVCVVTTHGRRSAEWLQGQAATYGLSEAAQQKVLQEFESKGYGYTDYAHQSGFGISLVTHERMHQLAVDIGGWDETLFQEHSWDDHQDVYAFSA